jgi:hypothetical protein
MADAAAIPLIILFPVAPIKNKDMMVDQQAARMYRTDSGNRNR